MLMKVKSQLVYNGKKYNPGEIIDIPDEKVELYKKRGMVEDLNPKK